MVVGDPPFPYLLFHSTPFSGKRIINQHLDIEAQSGEPEALHSYPGAPNKHLLAPDCLSKVPNGHVEALEATWGLQKASWGLKMDIGGLLMGYLGPPDSCFRPPDSNLQLVNDQWEPFMIVC